MKLITRFIMLTVMIFSGWSTVAWGYTGWCSADSGTQVFNYNFGNKEITDPNQNKAGIAYPDAFAWDLGGTYAGSCDCDPSYGTGRPVYFETKTSLPLGHNDGTAQYFKVNDYLEVATSIYMGGDVKDYVNTPWNNESNHGTSTGPHCGLDVNFSTGATGKLSLYIAKAFVGVSTINTKVLDIYASDTSGSFGGSPLASVNISGQVTVPQTCSINAGQVVTVDFGSFMSGEFKNKGQMPAGYTPKTITVPIKCNGIDANANLTLRFQAEASADEPAAIKTSNSDVGVQMTDDKGNEVTPNSGLIPFQLDDNLEATVTFHAAPISTTGNSPAEGTFSAQAYIRVDFA